MQEGPGEFGLDGAGGEDEPEQEGPQWGEADEEEGRGLSVDRMESETVSGSSFGCVYDGRRHAR